MLKIDIVQAPASELIARLGPNGTRQRTPFLYAHNSDALFRAAILREGAGQTMLTASIRHEPTPPRTDILPYADWHNAQASVSYWDAAYSWSLYWLGLSINAGGGPCWTEAVRERIPTPPLLRFLDLSYGRFAWHFQLELAYLLADLDRGRAVAFVKDWNRQTPSAVNAIETLRLPDGRTLHEVMRAHPTFIYGAMDSVPQHVAYKLIKE